MKVPRYRIPIINWGPVQDDGAVLSTLLPLADTGGTWEPVNAHETNRQGELGFELAAAIVHEFAVYSTLVGTAVLAFRLRDLTTATTLATVTPVVGAAVLTEVEFAPTLTLVDHAIRLEYQLALNGNSAGFYAGIWTVTRWQ